MKLLSLILVFIFALTLASSKLHPEANKAFMDYCSYFGYPVEKHYITTEDGYILGFFRIQAKGTTIREGLQPFYLQHGLIDSSDTWIVNEESHAPAFVLANKGYDVWLGNSRGNKHSRNHTILNPDKNASYWDFTFQHMADYDLPAAFKYISGRTGSKVHYLGHSQGTMIMHVALSKNNPVIETLLGKYFAFGPVAYVSNQNSRLLTALNKGGITNWIKLAHINQFLASPKWFQSEIGILFCAQFQHICADPLKYLSDADPNLDSYSRMDVIEGHYPSGTSSLNLYHWNQIIKSGKFQAYDWGTAALNTKYYGQSTPPVFQLKNVRVPLRLYSGNGDQLADPVDVQHLWSQLGPGAQGFFKTYTAGHATFMWGQDISPWMNDVYRFL